MVFIKNLKFLYPLLCPTNNTNLNDNILCDLTADHQLFDNYNKIQEKQGRYITLEDIDNIVTQEELDRLQKEREISGIYLANSLQLGFIYHALNQGDVDDAYLVQMLWDYNSKIDLDKLKQAWEYAQSKYPALRMRLSWREELVQIIDKQGELDWRYIDISEELDEDIRKAKIKQIQLLDRKERYNLEDGNLFRVYLIKQKEDRYSCIFSNHHAILDGWSSPILLKYIHTRSD